jgi:hypothetical protein
MMSIALKPVQPMTHEGTYRCIARLRSTSGTVAVRLVYDIGDLVFPAENRRWSLPGANQSYIADLGEVRLQRPPTAGDYSWTWQIQALGSVGGESVSVDKLWFIPVDEFASQVMAPINTARGLTIYSARDEFNQTAGAVTGKTLPVGGAWSGSGDADDFAIDATGHYLTRSATADSGVAFLGGRFIIPTGTASMTAQAVSVDVMATSVDLSAGLMCILLRYRDINNFVAVWVSAGTNSAPPQMDALRMAGGVGEPLYLDPSGSNILIPAADPNGVFRRFTAAVTADGVLTVMLGTGDSVTYRYMVFDANLATGGSLASGGCGLLDNYQDRDVVIRYYDNFACWVPQSDAAIFANAIAELRTEGHFRTDNTGTVFGRVSNATGNLPRLPVSGVTGQPIELLLKNSRGDLDQLRDPALDSLQAQAFYRPCWLNLPGA